MLTISEYKLSHLYTYVYLQNELQFDYYILILSLPKTRNHDTNIYITMRFRLKITDIKRL